MKPNPQFDELFASWLEARKDVLKRIGLLAYGPEKKGPGIGNWRFIDEITPKEFVIREFSESSPSRNKIFRFTLTEIRSGLQQMYEDREAEETRPKALYKKYANEGRTIKFLIEFKYDMFQDLKVFEKNRPPSN